MLFLLKVERAVSHSHGENAHSTCVLQRSHVTANMSPHAAQQVEIAAIWGAKEQEQTLLLCTIFPFYSTHPHHYPHPPFAATLFVCVRLFLMSC